MIDNYLSTLADGMPGVTYDGAELALGLPLGALGTGYTILRGDGRLGQTTIFNDFPAAYTLAQPRDLKRDFLAVKPAGGEVAILACHSDVVVADGSHYASSISYSGHYPFAQLEYQLPTAATASLEAWTPFVLGEAEISNTPSAVFDISLDLGCSSEPAPAYVDVVAKFPLDDTTSEYVARPVGPRSYSWEVALFGRTAGQTLTVVESQSSEVLAAGFGRLDPEAFASADWAAGRETGDAAVIVRIALDKNGRGRVSIVHSWFYPSFEVGYAFPYSHMYGTRFDSSTEVSKYTARNLSMLRKASRAWQGELFSSNLPPWLGDALVNSLYCIAKNSWWNTDSEPDSHIGPNGLFTMNETFRDCPVTNTMPCHYFAHLPILWFFPELERSTIEAFEAFQLRSGEIPFAFAYGSGLYDPRYHCVHTANSAMYVELVARYFRRTGDTDWLRSRFASVAMAERFASSMDFDGDGLIEERPHALPTRLWPANNYHDAFPWHGVAAHTNGIWLSSLASFVEICVALDHKDLADEAASRLRSAVVKFDELLWNGRYFRMYADGTSQAGEASLVNQLCGEWARIVAARPGLIAGQRVHASLDSILALNVTPFLLPTEAVNPDGTPVRVGGHMGGASLAQEQGLNCMVSEALCLAATLVANGRVDEGLGIARSTWETQAIRWKTPFDQYYMLATEDGRPVWGNDYLSNLVIWSLVAALDHENANLPGLVTNVLGRVRSVISGDSE